MKDRISLFLYPFNFFQLAFPRQYFVPSLFIPVSKFFKEASFLCGLLLFSFESLQLGLFEFVKSALVFQHLSFAHQFDSFVACETVYRKRREHRKLVTTRQAKNKLERNVNCASLHHEDSDESTQLPKIPHCMAPRCDILPSSSCAYYHNNISQEKMR